ncbi:MAG: hypothetical protein RLZZ400_367 [Actinomycetota bacterium]
MEILNEVLLVLHIVGVGALLSGFFYQMRDWGKGMKVNAGIIHGAWLMLVTGFAMTGIISSLHNGEEVNNIVLGIKSIVITAIFFIAYSFNKKEVTPKWVVPTIALLTTVNIAFAVLGHIVVDAA